jgi:multiple antibiotic resistance protein
VRKVSHQPRGQKPMIDGFLVARALNDFLFGFSTMFAIINPPAIALVFYARTAAVSDAARRRLAWRVASYVFYMLVGSLVLGSHVLGFFGISVAALRMGGGLVVALAGYAMLTSNDAEDAPTQTEAELNRSAFFPLTMPLTAGPGSIAAAIALGAQTTETTAAYVAGLVANLLVAAMIALTVFLCYRHSARIARLLGKEGARVAMRLTAFLLFCLGIQIFLNGFLEAMGALVRAAR